MSFQTSRRDLLGGAAAFLAAGSAGAAPAGKQGVQAAPFKLGIATYSLRNFSRSGAIKAARTLNIPYINIKEVHLPLDASASEIAAARREFERAKLTVLGVGNVSLTRRVGKEAPGQPDQRATAPVSDEDMRKRFEYAKAIGAPVMVMAPMQESLKKIEALAKEFQIKVAIHNHGPEDKYFPAPSDVLKAVDGLDPLMGLCIDVGHTARTNDEVVESVRRAGKRLHDMHIKDLRSLKDKSSQVPVGDGAMPVVAIFKELIKMNYTGGVMLEYEIDDQDPVPGMQKSFSYMRGVLDGLLA